MIECASENSNARSRLRPLRYSKAKTNNGLPHRVSDPQIALSVTKPGMAASGGHSDQLALMIEDRHFKGLPPPPEPRSRPSTPPVPYASRPRAHQQVQGYPIRSPSSFSSPSTTLGQPPLRTDDRARRRREPSLEGTARQVVVSSVLALVGLWPVVQTLEKLSGVSMFRVLKQTSYLGDQNLADLGGGGEEELLSCVYVI
jgi:hypothetical protein